MSLGTCHMPMSAEATAPAMPATVACAAAAGPAASGPISGARKPNTPAKDSAADDRIERTIAAPWAAIDAARAGFLRPRARGDAGRGRGRFHRLADHISGDRRLAERDELDQQVFKHVLEGGVPGFGSGEEPVQLRVERAARSYWRTPGIPAAAPAATERVSVVISSSRRRVASMAGRRGAAARRATARRAPRLLQRPELGRIGLLDRPRGQRDLFAAA